MSKDKANHVEMKSMLHEVSKALAILETLSLTVKVTVRAQGTSLWIRQKVQQAVECVEKVRTSIGSIDKTLLDQPPVPSAADTPATV